MATFKVGQRVKWVAKAHYRDDPPIGTEGTVIPRLSHAIGDEVSVRQDNGSNVYAMPFQLTPLTDPGFEQFMERVMKPIKEPVTA